MTNLTHAHMNEIGIPTVLESSVVQIEMLLIRQIVCHMCDASLLWLRSKNGQPMDTNFLTFFDHIEATFEFDPCTNYLVTPRLPVQDVTRQQYEIVILGPLPT